MNEHMSMNESNVRDNGRIDDEIQAMTDELYREMNGMVSRAAVERTLYALFANYEDAPVQLFVPIIVLRQAKELLRKLAVEASAANIAAQPG